MDRLRDVPEDGKESPASEKTVEPEERDRMFGSVDLGACNGMFGSV